MSAERGLGRVLAALLVLMALMARELHAPVSLEPQGAPLVVDSESAWRLHRISLALSSPRLAQSDRALSFPGERGVTQLPVHDELCALAARFGLGLSRGAVGERPNPRRLQRFFGGLAPLLSALTLLLLYRWLRRGQGLARTQALLGLAFVALLPGFFELGVPGMVTIEGLAALGLVVLISSMHGMWRSANPLDRMTSAMVCGALLGVGLATSPLFLAVLVAAFCTFILELQAAHGEERQNVARTAILFWITSALLSQLPKLGGPWVPAEGAVIGAWMDLLRHIFLVGGLPLVLGLAAVERDLSRARSCFFLVCAVASLALVLAFYEPANSIFSPLARVERGGWVAGLVVRVGALLGSAVLWFSWSRWRSSLDPEQLFLTSLCAFGLAAAFWAPPAIVLSLAPLASMVGHGSQGVRGVRLASGAVGLLLLAAVGAPWTARDARDPALQVARACLWLRDNSPELGAWGAATAVQEWGVGVEPQYAPLVAWHARKPAAALDERWARGSSLPGLVRGLSTARDLHEFEARSRAAGLRYWILTPHGAERLGCSPELVAALERLRIGESGATTGLSRLWASADDPRRCVSILGLGAP